MNTLTNHLWQSTLFAVAVALIALAFRRNRADVRYWLWFSASLKFFIPFVLLITLGNRIEWNQSTGKPPAAAITFAVEKITEPFSIDLRETSAAQGTPSNRSSLVSVTLWSAWFFGFASIGLMRLRDWRRVRRAISAGTPVQVSNFAIPAIVQVRTVPRLMEPCIVGWRRPILLLPIDITERLTQRQLKAVLAHEMCHVSRRDNLFAAIHMLAEAVFWFHPLIWFIGARLVEERERSCDEEVLRMGNEPLVYAEGILEICKNYPVSPLPCLSGVSGSNLRMRIQNIVTARVAWNLSGKRKVLLVGAGLCAVGVPLAAGMMHATSAPFQKPLQFEVATVRPTKLDEGVKSGCHGIDTKFAPNDQRAGIPLGRCIVMSGRLDQMIAFAYSLTQDSIKGIPSWAPGADRFDLEGKAENFSTATESQLMEMLRNALIDRFQLKFHRETQQVPGLALLVVKSGPKLQPTRGEKTASIEGVRTIDGKLTVSMAGSRNASAADLTSAPPGSTMTLTAQGASMDELVPILRAFSGAPVANETRLEGFYDFKLTFETGLSLSGPLQQQLGLTMESRRIPLIFFIIESAKKPTAN